MNFTATLLLGAALAMDAAAVTAALAVTRQRSFFLRTLLPCALVFGGFQALMPLLGFAAGSLASGVLQDYGRFVGAVLIALIGGKMLWENDAPQAASPGLGKLLTLGFATSIDALAVGVSFACLGRTAIWCDALLIGLVTALIVVVAGVLGRGAGRFCGRYCSRAGGAVLILIALKILIIG